MNNLFKSQLNPPPSQINFDKPLEVIYWTKKLGVSTTDLIIAVNRVGTLVKDVKTYLKKTKS